MSVNPIKVEIGQYRELNKGSLKATFSLVIYPEGQKILDCRYFEMSDKRWFSFPQKEIKYSDGRKTEYIPIVSYINKEYLESLKASVLNALKNHQPAGKPNVQTQHQTYSNAKNPFQAEPSTDYGELPF